MIRTRPFSGVTEGLTTPLGQVRLAVTFGTQANYRTELINFDVAHIGLPYNAILGYPALAKFMAQQKQQQKQQPPLAQKTPVTAT